MEEKNLELAESNNEAEALYNHLALLSGDEFEMQMAWREALTFYYR